MKVLDLAGKVLGITQTAVTAINIMDKIMDPTKNTTWTDCADLGIGVGSLFIKSNVVGFTVSAGWFIIKSVFEENR